MNEIFILLAPDFETLIVTKRTGYIRKIDEFEPRLRYIYAQMCNPALYIQHGEVCIFTNGLIFRPMGWILIKAHAPDN